MESTVNVSRTRNNIIIFSLATLLSGWLGVFINNFLGQKAGGGELNGGSLGELIWLLLPTITVVALRIANHDWKDAGLKFNLKKGFVWYITALLIYPVVSLLLILIGMLTGWLDIAKLGDSFTASSIVPVIVQLLILKIFEEFPWRGYLAPKLLSLKLNDWMVYLLNGLVWASWHFAYYMVFLPDSYFSPDGSLSYRLKMCITSSIVIILWTVMYVELYRLSKSVWPCLLVHVTEDLMFMYVLKSWGSAVATGKGFLLDNNYGLISVALLFGTGLLLRAYRIRKERCNRAASL